MFFANLETDALVIDVDGDEYCVDLCFSQPRKFKTLGAAKRFCIREARKLHTLVGNQLTQLAEMEDSPAGTPAHPKRRD